MKFIIFALILLLLFGMFRSRRAFRRDRRWLRRTRMFGTDPDSITVRSADNVRLLSDDQIKPVDNDRDAG